MAHPSNGGVRRGAGYIRVSAVMGREGDSFMSPDVQREKIQAWADYRGFEIVEWYTDLDRSGRAGVHRPEFERMMADAKADPPLFEAVAVYRLTRFARSVSQAASRYRELREANVALVSVTEDIDTTTASGSFMQNMLFAMAEFESERIGEEWRAIHAARRRRGIAHMPGPTFGYQVEGASIIGIDEQEAAAVRTIYRMRAAGSSTAEISDWLFENGFRSKRAKNPRLARNVIRAMLRNPIYAGLVRTSDDELVEATHQPIVDRDLWEAVQATWQRTTSMARRAGGGSLSGLLVCSSCGHRLTSEGRRYRCKATENGRDCPQPVAVDAAETEDAVEQAFLRRLNPARMPNRGRLRQTRRQEAWRRQAAKLRARAAELTTALDQLADQRFVMGSLHDDDYRRQQERFLVERQQVLEEAAQLEATAQTVRPIDTDVVTGWKDRSPQARRRAMQTMIDRVDVSPAGGRGRHGLRTADRLRIHWLV